MPQYPILHDKTIEQDLWEVTHETIQSCGATHDTIRIWAVLKAFDKGVATPNFKLVPKEGKPADDAFFAAAKAYAHCGRPIAARYYPSLIRRNG
jgi:hypothetical protein